MFRRRAMFGGYRLFLWAVLVFIFLIAFVLKFRHVYFPNSPCDCVDDSLLWYTNNANPTAQITCEYKYILRSGNYSDCAYFGPSCASYLEGHGVDCAVEDCGTSTNKQLEQEILDRIAAEKRTLNEKGFENRMLLQQEMMEALVASHPATGEMGVTNLPTYLDDAGCYD